MKNKKKSKAFTLAEVLITLTIIGVVSALTIPNMIKQNEKQMTALQLKKIYSQLNQVIKFIITNEGEQALAQKPATFVQEYILPNFKGTEYFAPSGNHLKAMCYEPNDFYIGAKNGVDAQYAFSNKKGQSSGSISTPFYYTTASIRLAGGACIGFNQLINPPIYADSTIFVDVNGSNKPPNRAGRDLFFFYVDQDTYTVTPTDKVGRLDFTGNGFGAKIIMSNGWIIDKNYPWQK